MVKEIIVSEIQDSWETMIDKINKGTADYAVGQYKPLDLDYQGVVNMQIVKTYADRSCVNKPTYDFVSMETLRMEHQINDWHSLTNEWEDSSMRLYLHKMIFLLIPETVRNAIKKAIKATISHSGYIRLTEDYLWIPSYEEIFGGVYGDIYHDANSRQKVFTGTSCASVWWLRSAYSGISDCFRIVNANGTADGNYAVNSFGVALGFSL